MITRLSSSVGLPAAGRVQVQATKTVYNLELELELELCHSFKVSISSTLTVENVL